MFRAYRTELDPSRRQEIELRKHLGTARWTYNWGLQRKLSCRKESRPAPNWMGLSRELNASKATDYPWLYDVSKSIPIEALKDLDRAFVAFFMRGKSRKARVGFPKFRRRRDDRGSCRFRGIIRLSTRPIQLPRVGLIRLKETDYLPSSGVKVLSATVTHTAGHWFASVNVQESIQIPENPGPAIGVDLGLTALATLSDGTVVAPPRFLQRESRRLRRAARALSRAAPKSHNRAKAKRRLARLHLRVANRRKDAIHKFTSSLTRTKSVIVIEDLGISRLRRNHSLAAAFQDRSLAEVRRQLLYKSTWHGSRVIVVPNFSPSTRTCSSCGYRNPAVPLAERVFRCEVCGESLDRDLNAALNLVAVAASSADTKNACRVGIRPLFERQPTMKQEPDSPENGQTSDIHLPGSGG